MYFKIVDRKVEKLTVGQSKDKTVYFKSSLMNGGTIYDIHRFMDINVKTFRKMNYSYENNGIIV